MTRPQAMVAAGKRRYIVQLLAEAGESPSEPQYRARIRPWSTRCNHIIQALERAFEDEDELVRTVNPLLPEGSDVRHVMMHIAEGDGFFYLLQLSSAEAERLGWHG